MVDEDGTAVAALVHDPVLGKDDELLSAVGSLVLAALKHERLTSRLAASLAQLEESRKRISTAADAERSRIERDLHDGAQQRLIVLRIKLGLAEDLARTSPAEAAGALSDLGEEIDLAIDELRALAHGVYPSLLTDRGVADALRGAVLESPLPIHFEARGLGRQPPEVEAAVYFACLEAVQNAFKHARGASGVWISLRQNHALRFEVRDDGPGFAPAGGQANGGLRNMRDRVEAAGGRLVIDSSPGRGTCVSGWVPVVRRPFVPARRQRTGAHPWPWSPRMGRWDAYECDPDSSLRRHDARMTALESTSGEARRYGEEPAWQPERPRIRPVRLVMAWAVSAAAVEVAALLLPGVALHATGAAFLVAAAIAVLNALLPPLLAASACRSCSRPASS